MKRFTGLCILICVLGVAMSATVFAQGAKFSVDFNKTPLSQVLAALKRFDPNLQFSLPQDYADVQITASLVDVTVDQALQMVLDQANLMSVMDNGVYQIRQKPEAHVERAERPAAALPVMPVWIQRAASPTEGIDTGAAAGAVGGAPTGIVGGAPGAPGATPGAPLDKTKLPWHLMFTRYMDPADLAGTIVYGNSGLQSQGGGGNGGGSQGGYGNTSGTNTSGNTSGTTNRGNTSGGLGGGTSGRSGY